MAERETLIKKARELAQADVGSEDWSNRLKTSVLSASDSDFGLFVVATAVLQDAREKRLDELSSLYREAQRKFDAGDFRDAQRTFQSLGDYSDARQRAKQAAAKEQERIEKEEALRRKNEAEYKRAQDLESQKKYDQARKKYIALGSFKDASRKASELQGTENQYQSAVSKYKAGNYAQAEQEFRRLGDYKDSGPYAKKALKEQKRESELIRAEKLECTANELRKEKSTYNNYKSQLLEAQRLSNKTSSELYSWAKDTAFLWVGLILAALFFLFAGGDPYGQAERYPILKYGLIAGFAAFAALIIGYFIDQHRQANRSLAERIKKNLPYSIQYHEAVTSYAQRNRSGYGRYSNNKVTVEEIDKYLKVLDDKIDELTKQSSSIRKTYSSSPATSFSSTSKEQPRKSSTVSSSTISNGSAKTADGTSNFKTALAIVFAVALIVAVFVIAFNAYSSPDNPGAVENTTDFEITEEISIDVLFNNPSINEEGQLTIESITNNTDYTIRQLSFALYAWDVNDAPIVQAENDLGMFGACIALTATDEAIKPGETRDISSIYWQLDKSLSPKIARLSAVPYTMQDTKLIGYGNIDILPDEMREGRG